jgi:hypothetical protein
MRCLRNCCPELDWGRIIKHCVGGYHVLTRWCRVSNATGADRHVRNVRNGDSGKALTSISDSGRMRVSLDRALEGCMCQTYAAGPGVTFCPDPSAGTYTAVLQVMVEIGVDPRVVGRPSRNVLSGAQAGVGETAIKKREDAAESSRASNYSDQRALA